MPSKVKGRGFPWTDAENDAFWRARRKHDPRTWGYCAAIKKDPEFAAALVRRDNVSLKDRARNKQFLLFEARRNRELATREGSAAPHAADEDEEMTPRASDDDVSDEMDEMPQIDDAAQRPDHQPAAMDLVDASRAAPADAPAASPRAADEDEVMMAPRDEVTPTEDEVTASARIETDVRTDAEDADDARVADVAADRAARGRERDGDKSDATRDARRPVHPVGSSAHFRVGRWPQNVRGLAAGKRLNENAKRAVVARGNMPPGPSRPLPPSPLGFAAPYPLPAAQKFPARSRMESEVVVHRAERRPREYRSVHRLSEDSPPPKSMRPSRDENTDSRHSHAPRVPDLMRTLGGQVSSRGLNLAARGLASSAQNPQTFLGQCELDLLKLGKGVRSFGDDKSRCWERRKDEVLHLANAEAEHVRAQAIGVLFHFARMLPEVVNLRGALSAAMGLFSALVEADQCFLLEKISSLLPATERWERFGAAIVAVVHTCRSARVRMLLLREIWSWSQDAAIGEQVRESSGVWNALIASYLYAPKKEREVALKVLVEFDTCWRHTAIAGAQGNILKALHEFYHSGMFVSYVPRAASKRLAAAIRKEDADDEMTWTSEGLASYLRSGRDSDFVVRSGDATLGVNAHRFILRARSPFFDAMLGDSRNWRETREGVCSLSSLSPRATRALVHYLYTGALLPNDASDAEVLEVLREGDAIADELDAHCVDKRDVERLIAAVAAGKVLSHIKDAHKNHACRRFETITQVSAHHRAPLGPDQNREKQARVMPVNTTSDAGDGDFIFNVGGDAWEDGASAATGRGALERAANILYG